LEQKATVAKIATVQMEGKRKVKREIEYYNLDLILSVGYRVNSKTATKFRQWASKVMSQIDLKNAAIKLVFTLFFIYLQKNAAIIYFKCSN